MAVKTLWRRLTPLDRILVLALAILVGSTFLLSVRRQPGAQVVVEAEGRIVWSAPLEGERSFEITGPLGTSRLEIANGAVRMISSPCPQKICIGLGPVRHSGDLLACVPNRVVVRIEGDPQEAAYDLLSR